MWPPSSIPFVCSHQYVSFLFFSFCYFVLIFLSFFSSCSSGSQLSFRYYPFHPLLFISLLIQISHFSSVSLTSLLHFLLVPLNLFIYYLPDFNYAAFYALLLFHFWCFFLSCLYALNVFLFLNCSSTGFLICFFNIILCLCHFPSVSLTPFLYFFFSLLNFFIHYLTDFYYAISNAFLLFHFWCFFLLCLYALITSLLHNSPSTGFLICFSKIMLCL